MGVGLHRLTRPARVGGEVPQLGEPVPDRQHRLARPARVGGEVPQLGEPVPDRQHGFGVVQVDGGPECHAGEHGRAHVGEAHAGVGGQDVAAASRAVSPVAHAGLVEAAEEV